MYDRGSSVFREVYFFMRQKQRISLFGSIRVLTMTAMLIATSVVIGIFCKTFLNFGLGLFRITFENLPILMTGILFGPIVGALAGAASDIISYLLSPQAYPINLLVTLGATMIGLISGLFSHYVFRKPGYAHVIIPCALAHLVGSMIIKPIGLVQFYGVAVLWRIPLYLVIAPIEITLLCLLYKNRGVRRLMDSFGGSKHELP